MMRSVLYACIYCFLDSIRFPDLEVFFKWGTKMISWALLIFLWLPARLDTCYYKTWQQWLWLCISMTSVPPATGAVSCKGNAWVHGPASSLLIGRAKGDGDGGGWMAGSIWVLVQLWLLYEEQPRMWLRESPSWNEAHDDSWKRGRVNFA